MQKRCIVFDGFPQINRYVVRGDLRLPIWRLVQERRTAVRLYVRLFHHSPMGCAHR